MRQCLVVAMNTNQAARNTSRHKKGNKKEAKGNQSILHFFQIGHRPVRQQYSEVDEHNSDENNFNVETEPVATNFHGSAHSPMDSLHAASDCGRC